MFTSALERGVGICPRDVVRESMRIELTRRADAEIGARMVGAGMPIPADVDIGLGRPTFYGSAVDQHFRFYGTVRRRARAELRDLAQLPDWADLGIKFASSLVVSQIESEISKYGGAIVGGPTFHGGRSFDLVGRGEERKTIKIACVEFGIVVTVTARLRCSLNVHGSRIVDLTVTEVNRNVDTDIKPFTPPGIGHLLEGLISSAVSRLIPAMNYNRRFVIESAERVDIQIDGAALRVFVKMP